MLCGASWECSPKFRLLRNSFYSGIGQQQEICVCKNQVVSLFGDGQDTHAASVPHCSPGQFCACPKAGEPDVPPWERQQWRGKMHVLQLSKCTNLVTTPLLRYSSQLALQTNCIHLECVLSSVWDKISEPLSICLTIPIKGKVLPVPTAAEIISSPQHIWKSKSRCGPRRLSD